MLRTISIRSRIFILLAVPLLVLVPGAGLLSSGAFADAARSGRVASLASATDSLEDLVRALQTERTVTVLAERGDARAVEQLPGARGDTDDALARFADAVTAGGAGSLSDPAADAVTRVLGVPARLDSTRAGIDTGDFAAETVLREYSAYLAAEISLTGEVAGSLEDAGQARLLRAYTELATAAEASARERDAGLLVLTLPAGAEPVHLDALVGPVSLQDAALGRFARLAGQEHAERLTTALMQSEQVSRQLPQLRQAFREAGAGQQPAVDPQAWRAATDERVDVVAGVAAGLAVDAAELASAAQATSQAKALGLLALAAAALVLPLLLALATARSITRPLARLTTSVEELRAALPAMLGPAGGDSSALRLPDVPVEPQDEVAELARAVRGVHETTVVLAREQSSGHGGDMVVSMAHRHHQLLARQIDLIDELERAEHDPEALDSLFRLDHLANRMQRTLDSLLVLAGSSQGSLHRQPMALSDVVRTAASRIEHYRRVTLSSVASDPRVVAHECLSLAHLLAEVLENATAFSEPGTPVTVSTATVPGGVVVTVADRGRGMSEQELEAANARVSDPSAAEVAGPGLGFVVVGRLAQRLGVTLRLRVGDGGGTVVEVELPLSVLVAESLADLETSDADTSEPATIAPVARVPLTTVDILPSHRGQARRRARWSAAAAAAAPAGDGQAAPRAPQPVPAEPPAAPPPVPAAGPTPADTVEAAPSGSTLFSAPPTTAGGALVGLPPGSPAAGIELGSLFARSESASEALTELTRLSTYRPVSPQDAMLSGVPQTMQHAGKIPGPRGATPALEPDGA